LSHVKKVSVAGVIVCLLLLGGHKAGFTQADDDLWSQPVNLSRSGAAESPLLMVGPDRQIQAFWWDRFDGLTTAYVRDADWSAPTSAPIQMEAESALLAPSTIPAMPRIVGVGETAFALWLGTPDRETNLQSLLYSRLRLGTTAWTTPETLAESAIAWEMTSDAQGVLHLIYCRTQQLDAFPAGIYHMRSTDGGVTWSEPVALYTSLYTRLWTVDTAHLSLAADASGNVVAGWDDSRQAVAFYVFSTDGGLSWSEPAEVGDGQIVGLHPRFIALPALSRQGQAAGFVLLWEQSGVASTCVLQQQRSEDGGKTWSAPSRVFEELIACPVQLATVQTPAGLLLLMRGEETGYLSVAVWDGAQWSMLKRLSFSFENPQTGTTTYLEALQADMTLDNKLVVVGQERDGDIWMLEGQVDTLGWVFAPPSPWSSPTIISEDGSVPGSPAVATDAEGRVHVMWSAPRSAGQSGSVLYYSRREQTSWSRPVAVLGTDEGVAQAPALLFVEPFLHAVWNGGPTGTVFYSRAYPDDAFSVNGWSQQAMSDKATVGGTATITADLLGRLHVVYAVSLNEGRGIYYARSDDNGESWREVVQLFDAGAEGWPCVDHPGIAVDENGVIHVVWVRAPLPGYGLPQGVYYARSADDGETWTSAVLLADGAYDWPYIAATMTGQVLVTWQDLARDIVQYRVSNDYGLSWDYVSQIPGLQAIEGHTALAQDNTGRLHITALGTTVGDAVLLHYLVYAEGQWSGLDSVELAGVYAPTGGGVPAVAGEPEFIDVVGLGSQRQDKVLTPMLWHTRRGIERRPAFAPNLAAEPTAVPMPESSPTPTPTPRPVVNPYPPQPSTPVLALGPITLPVLALGGIGMALLLVVGLVVIKVIKR